MKASLILALPALAIAAATPPTVEPRQLPPLNTDCLRNIPNIAQCLTNIGTVTGNPFVLTDIIACAATLPLNVVTALVAAATQCRLPIPVKE
ncbi:hypothetical protein SNK03_005809 [Fusarium graminearum]|uniref:Chromosome 2, complete genome n=1 Tax=Gibberella zeae (strain ATCC MYA-4620 / CBS 123657 / FGSC 9075 / NRRL 31084 / PH-1) TaxID=229533 RepID=A0A0E0S372_GIBZE|nr:hypothetical protein FG05_30400 [Fusarium graminearum]CAF3502087.1 unnamed protein product [Fusarium graminearum]CEF77947.1 unnamed protein product [Fusarium graminearum]